MTGRTISLHATDGHTLSAYVVRSARAPRGGLVLLQEIFGITAHVRSVCDHYAARGYHVVAPALFDRVQRHVELDNSEAGAGIGRELRGRIPWEQTLADVEASLQHISDAGKRATIGYCWGGTVSWRAAAHLAGVAAAVCYYPTQIGPYIAEQPRCPVLMHFGERDPIATFEQAGQLRAAQGAAVEIQVYPAGHGFNCEDIANFHPPSAALALRRSLEFLTAHIG